MVKNNLKMKIQYILLSNLFLFFICSAGWATTYYVDKAKGSNSNSGKSASSAFRTIQNAADRMRAGDNCIVQPGDYNERVYVNVSGSSSAPIKFEANGVVINRGFKIDADYIKVIGFEMKGNGISVEGKYCEILNNNIHNVNYVGIDLVTSPSYTDNTSTSNNTVRDNTIAYAVKCGIRVMGRNNLIESNDISHTLECAPDGSYCDDADGIRFFGSGHIIRKNYIHDILHEPENFNDPHIDFFQTWPTARNITIEQNICYSPNTSGSNQIVRQESWGGEWVEGLTFKNNIFIMSDPGYCPMLLDEIRNVVIVNNTFVHLNPKGMGQYAIWLVTTENVTVKNNIFYDFGDEYSWSSYIVIDGMAKNHDIGNNCVYTTNGRAPRGGPYPNDLWMINPKFKDFKNLNFRLVQNSPLIDRGINLPEVKNDWDGNTRPQGAAYDIGAFEYLSGNGGGDSSKPPSSPTNLRVIN
jgi:hypothetical protein